LDINERIKVFKEITETNSRATVDKTLGIEIESHDPLVLKVEVDERLFQPMGYLHGGVSVLLAESAASVCGYLAVDLRKEYVLGMEINANHLKSVQRGTLRAYPTAIKQTRSSMIVGIEIKDQDQNLICISRCTLAIREKR